MEDPIDPPPLPDATIEDAEEPALVDEAAVDPAQAEKPICKVTGPKNASMGGKSLKDRSQFRGDQKLKDLLASADEITSLEHFTYWKDEFLHTFQQYLDPEETANAREADEKLYVRMQKLAKICMQLKELCGNGGISAEEINVRGQRAISEFISELARSEKIIHEYFPKTQEDEAVVNYNKFNLAAVLIRDGFRVYDLMVTTRDYILNLRDNELNAPRILTANHRSIIQYYLKEIDSFCDCLADLGMYKLMNKCVELYKVRPRNKKKKAFDRKTMDPLSDTEDEKASSAGRMFRRSKVNFRSIMDHGWTSGVTRREVNAPDEVEAKPNGTLRQSVQRDEKKPDPRKPNDWIYYYDPATNKIGKIPRKRAIGDNFIIQQDESGKEQQDSAIEAWDGPDGKGELIWKLKDACKGKVATKK